LHGAHSFTSLDLRQAYLQLQVHPSSQKFLGISTSWGIYQQTRLAFGLSCAAQVFQQFIDTLTKGIPGVICYLDNVLVYAETDEECFKRVQMVLRRFEEANVKVRKEKCLFFKNKIIYLGHEISSEGVTIAPDKLQPIIDCPHNSLNPV